MPTKKMSKSENKAYKEAKKRLEKSQSKYTIGYVKSAARKAPRSARSTTARRWKDWRLTDGEEAPITTYKL